MIRQPKDSNYLEAKNIEEAARVIAGYSGYTCVVWKGQYFSRMECGQELSINQAKQYLREMWAELDRLPEPYESV